MGIVNKIIIGVVLFALMFGLVSISEASSNVMVTELSTIYDGGSTYGYIDLENTGDENITVVVGVFPDDSRIAVCEDVALDVKYFYGFLIPTRETLEFEVPNEEGYHTLEVVILIGNTTIIVSDSYEVYGEVEEEEEEVVEDWLECP